MSFRTFLLIWSGQFVSLVGSGLSHFALSLWVYRQTGSATQFALVLTCLTVPLAVLWPVAGVVADRWDRKRVLILSDTGNGAVTLVLFTLMASGSLEMWHLYAGLTLATACGAFQWPAYSASIPVLVPSEQLGRANGLVETAGGVSRVLNPLLGGVLLITIGIEAILLIDLATFVFAIGTLAVAHIPRHHRTEVDEAYQSLRHSLRVGWTYIAEREGLRLLVIFFIVTNFTCAFIYPLLAPLVLSFGSEATVGVVYAAGGAGIVTGGLLMSAWGGPQRLVRSVLVLTAAQGLAMVCLSIRSSLAFILPAIFGYGVCLAIIMAANQTLWQRKVSSHILGRVIAMRRGISGLSYPAAYVLAGPLADYVFEPALAPDGPLAVSVGQLLGMGEGRGIALMLILAGMATVVVTASFSLHPKIRSIEADLPDVAVAAAA